MSDGIVIIGSGFAARQLVKNIRKQDPQIPLTLIAADSMDEYNKPDLSHVISRGQSADDLTLQTAGEFAEQYNLRLFPHTWVSDIDAEGKVVKVRIASGATTSWCWRPAPRPLFRRCRAAS
ncbi:Nitric oxide reductase FlRd-NAD(+) reductase [Raoultella terrigena]|uniref:Nitric oxide reductase FlRd-NAD(+) reductase n=1 Tax=Raoultella terrigena TaxID=577 RepID=A0A4U9D1X0_RAOTE|nr:Nitric oxide reductase FlRd-NAD(+) reductase [Raoultella terrigena]